MHTYMQIYVTALPSLIQHW